MSSPSSPPLTVHDCQDFYDHTQKVYTDLYALGKDLEKFAIRARYTHGDTPNVIFTLMSMTTYLRIAINHFQTALVYAETLTHYSTWHPTRPLIPSARFLDNAGKEIETFNVGQEPVGN